jgi:hypothetical protein
LKSAENPPKTLLITVRILNAMIWCVCRDLLETGAAHGHTMGVQERAKTRFE